MINSRYIFHANALAVGGFVGRPYHETLDTQASSVLPTVGGKASASVKNYKYHGLISFTSASSTVHGNIEHTDDGRIFNTLSTVAVEGLNIADLITADLVVARLVSERAEHEPEQPLHPVGSYFVNLRVLGRPLDLQLHQVWSKTSHGAELLGLPADRQDDGHFHDRYQLSSLFEPSDLPAGAEFEQVEDPRRGHTKTPPAWRLYIPGFGKVYFGELIVSRQARRLSMIRLEMGSPCQGDVVVATTEGNGSTYP